MRKKVYQTIFTVEEGNCFAACVATILGLKLHDLPNFCAAGEGWWLQFQQWLNERGLVAVEFDLADRCMARMTPGVPCILTGPSPRFAGVKHAVVAVTAERGWELYHDPHPEGNFYEAEEATHVLFFAMLRPEVIFQFCDPLKLLPQQVEFRVPKQEASHEIAGSDRSLAAADVGNSADPPQS